MEKYIYTAGLLDGEGSIMLTKRKKNEFRSPCISITNTSVEIIDFLKSNFGGSVVKQKTYQPHHKEAWIWSLHHNKAIEFLKSITPFLKHQEKIYRANLILDEYKNVTKRNGKYSNSELLAKLDFEKRFFHPSIA